MEPRHTPSMKKGWICRTSYDEKNHEIEPMMMTQWWSRSSGDPDPVMLIQQRWSRSSDDDLDRVMIQIQDEDDLKMKMNWRCRWWDDPEKKTSVDKLCRQNTFLVKRECWCICNFGMYSLVYFMYCTPMFISRSICNVIESCHAPMFLSGSSIM